MSMAEMSKSEARGRIAYMRSQSPNGWFVEPYSYSLIQRKAHLYKPIAQFASLSDAALVMNIAISQSLPYAIITLDVDDDMGIFFFGYIGLLDNQPNGVFHDGLTGLIHTLEGFFGQEYEHWDELWQKG